MIKHYTLENKPKFFDGQEVKVDMERMGCPTFGILEGVVVGLGTSHVIDQWLVKFDCEFPSYPFKVLSVMHTAILDLS